MTREELIGAKFITSPKATRKYTIEEHPREDQVYVSWTTEDGHEIAGRTNYLVSTIVEHIRTKSWIIVGNTEPRYSIF